MYIKNFPHIVKRKAIYTWRNMKHTTGLNENFFRQVRGNRIVTYHGICLKDHLKFNSIFLRRQTFEQHLQFYQKYFHVVSLHDYFNRNFNEGKFNICITFDDGYYNNYKYV